MQHLKNSLVLTIFVVLWGAAIASSAAERTTPRPRMHHQGTGVALPEEAASAKAAPEGHAELWRATDLYVSQEPDGSFTAYFKGNLAQPKECGDGWIKIKHAYWHQTEDCDGQPSWWVHDDSLFEPTFEKIEPYKPDASPEMVSRKGIGTEETCYDVTKGKIYWWTNDEPLEAQSSTGTWYYWFHADRGTTDCGDTCLAVKWAYYNVRYLGDIDEYGCVGPTWEVYPIQLLDSPEEQP